MTKFKVGDIVELDANAFDYSYVKDQEDLQGSLKVTKVISCRNYVYVNDQAWYYHDWRFKHVKTLEQPSQSTPIKKPHAWVTIEKSSGKVTSMRITRKAIRFQQKLNRKLDKGTVIRKITYEVV